MTTRTFTVETRKSCIVIFGGGTELTNRLVEEFISKGVEAAKITSLKEFETIRQTCDPDYLVLFLDESTDPWLAGQGSEIFPVLKSLIESGESRLILVRGFGSDHLQIPLSPIAKQIIISGYVGQGEVASPLLDSWLKNIETTGALSIPGDGLGEFSLMGIGDVSELLVKAILYPGAKTGESIVIGNPTPISYLNLAYLVRTSLPFKINLGFDQSSEEVQPSFDSKNFEKTLEKLDYRIKESAEDLLRKYLKIHIKKQVVEQMLKPSKTDVVPVAAPVPQKIVLEPTPIKESALPPIKKLTPLRTSSPVFVPLQNRRPKKPFSLKSLLPTRSLSLASAKHSGPPRLRTIVARGLIIAVALYLGTIAFSVTIAGLSLNHIYASLRRDELPFASKLNNFAVTYLQANWVVFTGVPGLSKQKVVMDVNLLLDAYSQSLRVFETADSLSRSAEDLTKYIFGSGNADVAQVMSFSRLQAEELYQKLSLLDGSLPVEPPKLVGVKYQSAYLEGKAKLAKLKRSITTTRALLATAPDIIGLGGRRKYAVLFQNNMELRATGGFIGSFAILSFENGKLYDMPIYDVYDADGQLKGHVDPPKPIKDFLGEANWYLRDSNFDPDFPSSARRAEWFIKKSLNQDLDGTIAVNVNTLVALLKATGPLNIPDYNETITSENLYERSQFHAEVNFFPGSTQKKEFLSTVANALFTRLPTLSSGEGLKLVGALSDTVQGKDTLISLASETSDHVFATLGWNGALNDFPCPTSSSCHKDYLMVVDSNFGVNKANYFIKRNIEEIITFDKDLAVTHTLRVNYQNTSTSTAWPAGAYKNYERLYIPVGANIIQIKVGGKVLSSSEYVVSSEHGKFVVAYLVLVPINENVTVEAVYTTPQLPQAPELLYTWYWQKQPGTSASDSISVYLNYPMYLRPLIISPTATLAPQQLKFDMKNDTDHRVTVKFTK